MTQEQLKHEILTNLLLSSNNTLFQECNNFFKYIDLIEEENKLKTKKIEELYKDNMTLHKEIILLLESK